MPYSIYGTPYKPSEQVCYGTVDTIGQARTELRKLREAGVAEVYAIGYDPEAANAGEPAVGS